MSSKGYKLDISQQKMNLQDCIYISSKTRKEQIKGFPKSLFQKHKSSVQTCYSAVLTENITERPTIKIIIFNFNRIYSKEKQPWESIFSG